MKGGIIEEHRLIAVGLVEVPAAEDQVIQRGEGDKLGATDGGDDKFRARREGHTLRMIAARIGNDSALPFLFGERRKLVVGPPQLEGPDRLLIFGLKVEPRFCGKLDELRSYRHTAQARLSLLNVVQRNDDKFSNTEQLLSTNH